MSKTKNWLMDMEEQFYDIADKAIGGCEHIDEFKATMQKHNGLMTGLYSDDEIDDVLCEMWHEKWSKYATN